MSKFKKAWKKSQRWCFSSIAALLLASPLHAQNSVAEQLSTGDREYAARKAQAALVHYEAALDEAPENYGALWRTSRTLIDLAEFDENAQRRKSAFTRAAELARQAIGVNPSDAEAHFHLARALGREALSVSVRERTRYALDVRTTALKVLELDPSHAGAMHVLGRWHAEVMRLNGFTRMIAKTFMGGKVFGSASWGEAIRLLQGANAEEPNRTVHQLALAQIYRDAGEGAKARAMFEAAVAAPLWDVNDEKYKAQARQELRALK